MAQGEDIKRSQLGYGSTYAQGSDYSDKQGIRTVLGGQTWTVSPDQRAEAANPCIWMQAGVAKFKNCNNYYDCPSCKYDFGMKKRVAEGKQISWQDAMRKHAALDRICRHSLTQRIERRSCAYDYRCETCDFDQFFEDVWSPKTKTFPLETQTIKGFEMPAMYHFHDGHTWARIESGGFIRIGLDDFALKVLGRADAFDLPLMGKQLDPGKAGWGLRRKDLQADVLSPVGGVIMEVNSKVRENPSLANGEPYGEGWLFIVRTPDIKKSMNALMTDAVSVEWMQGEVGRLQNMIEEVAGPLAADGGHWVNDIFGAMPQLGWRNLTQAFLKS